MSGATFRRNRAGREAVARAPSAPLTRCPARRARARRGVPPPAGEPTGASARDGGMTCLRYSATMRALLVQGSTPPTYWGYGHSLPFIRKDAALPPLGLATLAAHLPPGWELRLHDLHLGPLPDELLRWADAVLVSGMLVQAPSMRATLARARALGSPAWRAARRPPPPRSASRRRRTCSGARRRVGSSGSSRRWSGRGPSASRLLSPPGESRPDLALARVPRFDLIALDRYASHAIQVSRGCPFTCEFCDIIEVFGRVPRVKSPAQVLAELDALRQLGARGRSSSSTTTSSATGARPRGSCRSFRAGSARTASPSTSTRRRASTSRRCPSSSAR